MLIQERVHHLFTLNPLDGRLIRRFKRGLAEEGTSSLASDRDGYLIIGIDGKQYRAHRVVWLHHYGQFPDGCLDHVNRIRTDNRIENLREVSKSQSRQNIGISKSNKSGIKGIWEHTTMKGKWCASIGYKGKNVYLGIFTSIDDAALAYKKAAAIYHTMNPDALRENP